MSQRIRNSRRTRPGWRYAAAVVAVALLVAGCGGSSGGSTGTTSGGGKKVVVGLITKTDTNPFFVKMKEGAQKAADAAGAKLLTAAGKFDGDNAGQVTALENMVAAGAKGILITPSDTKAIVPSIAKARAKGVLVIALDTPTDPQSAVDALFATNNFKAGVLIGQYTKAVEGGKTLKIATLDLAPGISVGILRHNGFISGLGAGTASETTTNLVNPPSVVCSNDTQGDQADPVAPLPQVTSLRDDELETWRAPNCRRQAHGSSCPSRPLYRRPRRIPNRDAIALRAPAVAATVSAA